MEEGHDVERVTETMLVAFGVQSATVNDAMSALLKLAREIGGVSGISQPECQ